MIDIRRYKIPTVPKECWHDPRKECGCNDPKTLDNTIMTNSKKKQADKTAWERINKNFGKMFADPDGDGIPTAFDKRPHKKDKRRFNIKRFI